MPEKTPIAIAGNKSDLESHRMVEKKEVEDFAKKIKGKHFNTSARTGKGIEEIFQELAVAIMKR